MRWFAGAIAWLAVSCIAAPRFQPLVQRQNPRKITPARDAGREAVRLNNLGAAYMNQQAFERALENFQQAYELDPKLLPARLNQGIALLNMQKMEEARKILIEVSEKDPKNIRAWYNLGLREKNLGQAETALQAFERAAQLDPEDADTRYFVGLLCNQLQKYEQAIAAFERALKLNPFHASAEFGLARAHQRAGNPEKSRVHLGRFQKITQEKLAAPMSLAYGDQGKYSLAEQVPPPTGAALPPIPVKFVRVPASESGIRFVHSGLRSPELRRDQGAHSIQHDAYLHGSGACFFDYDGDGQDDLFLVNAGEDAPSALYRNAGGHFVDVTAGAGIEMKGRGMGCAAGDYDNDGRTDLAVTLNERLVLLRNEAGGKFRDVTRASGIRDDNTEGRLLFFDYDHDGDLDLYVTLCIVWRPGADRTSRDAQYVTQNAEWRNVLWRNNGNGTFTDWTKETGLEGTVFSSLAAASDFDNDRAVDLLLGSDEATRLLEGQRERELAPPVLLRNPREGRFQALRPWPSFGKAETKAAIVLDFNKDGRMDVAFGHTWGPGLTLWRNVDGKRFEPQSLPYASSEMEAALDLVTVDYDNDGWLDLAALLYPRKSNAGHLLLLRNEGPSGFRDVSREVGANRLELVHPRTLLAADYDADGDPDLLITQNGGPIVLLRNEGGNKNNWIKLSLKGLADNKSAIGTKVEVFAGELYQKFEVHSPNKLLAGLGSEKEVDIVRLLWPTGVLQDEVQLASRTRRDLTEIDRRGSSCPILFAWNGDRYEFITDAIGPGIVGHWSAPGQRNIPDPTEYIKVEGSSVIPRSGRLSFRFAEPMEEIVYLDQVRLLAVDHPAKTEVYPNEYFASRPPFPEFKVITSRNARPPAGARDHHGRDVLPELKRRDRRYVKDFALLPYKGFAERHWVELDLGEINSAGPLRLLLHGLTDYFTATSVYAAHQAGVTAVVPHVEALDANGRWVRVVDDMGFPAGLARKMIADLTGRLPAGTRRIRIVTNLKIYWDQILMDTTADAIPVRLTEMPVAEATLAFRGYPREVRGNPPGDITYVYEEVSRTGPYAQPAGNYTRYGDVRTLLADVDDRFVIFGTGEEVALEFDPADLPPLLSGWTRDYFFYADGFAKDMDFYAAHADTVEPLPYHHMGGYPYPAERPYPQDDAHHNYRLDHNTRSVSGKTHPAYRFVFPRRR